MSKRNRREHGRIISVETLTRGDALASDAAAGATSITVNDAGDFDEDGGWLYIGAQTVEYTACDDDTGVITLATALTAAGEQGDPVQVWSDLYGEVVDYQLALVELDGEYDNPDPVVAEVAEGVGDLPEGDRGKAGESCTLLRVSDDEWEIVGVGGRPRQSQGSRWEANDSYTLTAADITAGTATAPLSHRPNVESVDARWRTTPQEPTAYTVNYDTKAVTWPLSGFEAVGDRLWFHYTYRKGVATAKIAPSLFGLPLAAWYSADYQATAFADGAAMTSLTDLSGNDRHSTGGQGVMHHTGGPAGGPYFAVVDGSTTLYLPSMNIEEGFFAIKQGLAGEQKFYNFGSAPTTGYYPRADGHVLDEFRDGVFADFMPTLSVTAWRRYNVVSKGSSASPGGDGYRHIRMDEVEQFVQTNISNTNSAPAGGGSALTWPSGTHDLRYAAILLFSRMLTEAERTQVVDFLQANPSGGLP